MKKQILILFVAFMASMSFAFGQVIEPDLTQAPTYCPTPSIITATCIEAPGPLNPTPGTLYNYSVSITPNTPAPTIHWFVTTDPDFISGGVLTTNIEVAATSAYIMAAGTTYNDPANVTPNVDITWQSIPSTQDVFLVTFVKDGNGCTNNIKVYKIVVQNTFMLDMAYMGANGTSSSVISSCVAPILGASYNSTATPPVVEMDYGVNYIFFVVNASNWAHSYLPTFQLTATNMGTSGTLAVDWAYPDQSYEGAVGLQWHATTVSTGIYTSVDPILPHTTPGATGVGAAGECIIVRVTVDHNQNETLADIVISLAVDGIMYDQNATAAPYYTNATLGDIHYADNPTVGQPCPWIDGYINDVLPYTLTLRPTVVDQTDPDPDDNFIGTNAD